MPTHPAMPAYKAGIRGALRVTDYMTQREFRKSPHYRETLLPAGLGYQTVVTLEIPGKIAGLTVNRDSDCSDREATLLQLISPQIALAYRNAHTLAALKRLVLGTIPPPAALEQAGLTPREPEVLHWVIQGKRDLEIALILSISVRTIQNHLRSIFQKLGVETRTGAVLEATERLKQSAVESY